MQHAVSVHAPQRKVNSPVARKLFGAEVDKAMIVFDGKL